MSINVKDYNFDYIKGNELLGRTALITGGTSGIGKQIAIDFLKAGCKLVIIVARNFDKLKIVKNELDELFPNRTLMLQYDISNVANLDSTIQEFIVSNKLCIDILVNNAGVLCNQLFPLITEEEYDRVMNINLKGTFFLSQFFVKYFVKNSIKGNIIMVGSSSSNRPAINPYMISKWGIRSITSGIAKAVIKYGVCVNGVAPGPTATPMLLDSFDDISNPKNPSNRYATVSEISSMCVYLASPIGRMIVGELVYVSGGAATITFDDQSYNLPEF